MTATHTGPHFYEPKNGHGLPHDPFNAIVGPRPIGWIGSVSASGVPNLQELLALIRSTMAALHHANTTKNYTVLRDMTAPSLRKNITPETLLKAFKGLREQSADLSQTLVLTPEVSEPPAIDEAGQLRLSGRFPTKPLTTQFEIAFKRVENAWLISDLSVTMLK